MPTYYNINKYEKIRFQNIYFLFRYDFEMKYFHLVLVFQLQVAVCFCHDETYKILIACPAVAPDGALLFRKMASLLGDAGHYITLISADPMSTNHSKVKDIYVNFRVQIAHCVGDEEPCGVGNSYVENIKTAAMKMWTIDEVEELYRNRNLLDALIVPLTDHDFVLPFLDGTDIPLITFSFTGIDQVNFGEKAGHWISLAVTPVLESKLPSRMGFLQRTENAYRFIRNMYFKWFHFAPMMNDLVSRCVPENVDIYE